MRGRAVIAGVGHTTYGKHPGRDKISLIVDAVRGAGLDIRDLSTEETDLEDIFLQLTGPAGTPAGTTSDAA